MGIITALTPYIGYQKAAVLAKEALETGIPIRLLIQRDKILDDQALDAILDPFNMTEPSVVGNDKIQKL